LEGYRVLYEFNPRVILTSIKPLGKPVLLAGEPDVEILIYRFIRLALPLYGKRSLAGRDQPALRHSAAKNVILRTRWILC
jgi:hypothetical protein